MWKEKAREIVHKGFKEKLTFERNEKEIVTQMNLEQPNQKPCV